MDIGLAFTYITKDREWIKKVLIGGLLSLIPIAGALILYGFMMRILRNVANNDPEPLPDWDNIGGDLTNGFLGAVGALVWTLPFLVLFVCLSALGGFSNDDFGFFSLVAWCFAYPLFIVAALVITPIIFGRLITTGQFGSMFQMNEILQQVRNVGPAPYALLLVVGIIAYFITMLGLLACVIGVIFTAVFAQFAIGHAMGQVYRQSLGGPTEYRTPAF